MPLSFKDLIPLQPARDFLFALTLGEGDDSLPAPLVVGGEFPFESLEEWTHNKGNTVTKFPGSYNLDDLSFDVWETNQNHLMNWWLLWNQSMKDDEGFYALPANYKKTIEVYRLNDDLTKAFGLRYTGCWPKQLSSFSPKSDGNGVLQYSITVSADQVSPIPISPKAVATSDQAQEFEAEEKHWLEKLEGGIDRFRRTYRNARMNWLLKRNEAEIAPSRIKARLNPF